MGSRGHGQALARRPLAIHDGDEELRIALAAVSAPLSEVLSLWPAARHDKLVLWAHFAPSGAPDVGARTREHDFDTTAGQGVARDILKIRGDVPVVLVLRDGRTVVLGWRAVRA